MYRVAFTDHGRHLITANGNGTLYLLRPVMESGCEPCWPRRTAGIGGARVTPPLGQATALPGIVAARIEGILNESKPTSPEQLRAIRAIQVLEQIGNPDAQALLKRLAQGTPQAPQTQQAQAALKRSPSGRQAKLSVRTSADERPWARKTQRPRWIPGPICQFELFIGLIGSRRVSEGQGIPVVSPFSPGDSGFYPGGSLQPALPLLLPPSLIALLA